MPALSPAEVEAFLDEPGHLVRIATVDADGHPRVVPTWFIRDGRQVLFTPRGTSAFLANLRHEPRVGLSIDEEPLPYRKVTVQGTVEVVRQPGEDEEWRDLYRRIARRYVTPEAADAYVDGTDDQPRALIAVDLDRSRVTTWRMPVAEENPAGIWARRYYLPGTRMAAQTGPPAEPGAS